jgi:hypothetical protein
MGLASRSNRRSMMPLQSLQQGSFTRSAESAGVSFSSTRPDGTTTIFGVVPKPRPTVTVWISRGVRRTVRPADGVYVVRARPPPVTRHRQPSPRGPRLRRGSAFGCRSVLRGPERPLPAELPVGDALQTSVEREQLRARSQRGRERERVGQSQRAMTGPELRSPSSNGAVDIE